MPDQETLTEEPPSEFIDPALVQYPNKGWACHQHNEIHHYVKVDVFCHMTHAVTVKKDKSISTFIGRKQVQLKQIHLAHLPKTAETANDLNLVLKTLDDLVPCSGDGFGGFSKMCIGAISKGNRCGKCKGSRKNEMKKLNRQRKAKARDRRNESIKRSKRIYRLRTQKLRLAQEVRFQLDFKCF